MSRGEQARRLQQVRRVLRYWDPLGVVEDADGGTGLNDDEYDSYARGVLRQLQAGRDWRGLAQHLVQLRLGWFGEGRPEASEWEVGVVKGLVVWRERGFQGDVEL